MGVGVERGRGILQVLAFECLEYAKIAVPATPHSGKEVICRCSSPIRASEHCPSTRG
jgi:hypothetical protein